MVSVKSERYLAPIPCVTVKWLESSTHYYYGGGDLELLLDDYKEFVSNMTYN